MATLIGLRVRLARQQRRLAHAERRVTAWRNSRQAWQKRIAATQAAITRLNDQAGKEWMPGVARDERPSIGKSTVGNRCGLLHTTEGLDFAAMDRVLKAKKAEPHFLVGRSGQVKQYRPLSDAATALENPAGGVETNRKRCVQIEVCAFAKDPAWPPAQRQAVARIINFLAANGIPKICTVKFTDQAHVHRMSGEQWLAYRGWCGHQHAPEQPSGHWDPGAIDIERLFRGD